MSPVATFIRRLLPVLGLAVFLPMTGCGQFSFSTGASLLHGRKQVTLSYLRVSSSSTLVDLMQQNASNPITITAMGNNDQPYAIATAGGLLISLSGFSPTSAKIYLLNTDGTCGAAIQDAAVTIPVGSDHVAICVQPLGLTPAVAQVNNSAYTLHLSAFAGGLSVGSIDLTIHPIPSQLRWDQSPIAIDLGQCTAVNLTVQDATGIAIPVSFTPFMVNLAGVTDIAFLDSACSTPATAFPLSQATTPIYLKPTSLSPISLGVASSMPAQIMGDTRSVSINSIPAGLKFPVSSASLPAGLLSTSAVELQVVNLLGSVQPLPAAPAPPLAVSLSVTTGSALIYTSNANGALPVTSLTISPGSYNTFFYVEPTSLGTVRIRATGTYNGNPLSPADFTINAVPTVAKVVITSPSGNSPETITGGIASGAFTLSLKDGLGNDYCPAQPLTISVTPGAALSGLVCNAAKCPPGSTSAVLTFSTNGSTHYPFYLYSDLAASVTGQAVAVNIHDPSAAQPDVNGSFPINAQRTPLAPDLMFQPNGRLTVPAGALGSEALSAVTAPGNTIIAAGYSGNDVARNVSLVKVLGTNSAAPGTLDNSFNGNGMYSFGLSLASFAYGVAVQTVPVAGQQYVRYLVGIQARGSDYDFALARVCDTHNDPGCPGAAGTPLLDQTFTPGSTTGQMVYQMFGNQMLKAVAVSPSTGNIFMVGTTDSGTDLDILIVAVKPDGTPLTPFNSTGTVQLNLGGTDDAYSALITGSGSSERLTIGAMSATSAGNNAYLLRFNTNTGLLDSGFGSSGMVKLPAGADVAQPVALVAQSTQVVAAFNHSSATVAGEIQLMRFYANGSRDTSIGSGGTVSLPVPAGTAQKASGLAVNPTDGSLYLSGTSTGGGEEDFLAWRVLGASLGVDPTLTSTATYNFGNIVTNHANGLVIDGNKPLLFGQAHAGSLNNLALMSLLR